MYAEILSASINSLITGAITGILMLLQAAIESGTIFIFLAIAILERIAKWYRAITR